MKMTSTSSMLKTLFDFVELYLRRLNLGKYQKVPRRRLFIALIIVSFFVLYICPLFFRWLWKTSPIESDIIRANLERELKPFAGEAEGYESNINFAFNAEEQIKRFSPYIGNGKFGLPLDQDNPFYIKGKRALDTILPFHPRIILDTLSANDQTADVVRFTEGVVHKIRSFSYLNTPATVSQILYAHRTIPSLLIQEIRVVNPTNVPLLIKLARQGWTGKQPLKKERLTAEDGTVYDVQYGEHRSPNDIRVVGFVVLSPQFTSTIAIPSNGRKTFIFKTFLNYTETMPIPELSRRSLHLKTTTIDLSKNYIGLSSNQLYQLHQKVWERLWFSGFGISKSKAKGALNGDVINATIYYILSQTKLFANDHIALNEQPTKNNALLSRPDRCYAGTPTLQATALWSNLDSLNDVQRIVSLWLLTLEKNGCHNLLAAGAEGTLQAVLLSFVAMQFHQNHLEMGIHPKELHRDYYLRRIRYNNATLVNVTMSVGDDNKASIYVALDKNADNKAFYACDAGCLDSPVQLSSVQRQFPVKITEPLTAILYITSDRSHIEELKHAIHVKEVAVAPAHESEIIALHKHGHQLGGLPAFFWITIFFLVVIFHIFFAKLIYNEYCGGSNSNRYAV